MNKILIPTALVLASGVFVFGFNSVRAAESQYQPIVTRIAQRFNLSEADVSKVFEEEREEMHSKMEVQLKENLSKAVADGKLTQAQADYLISHREKMEAGREDVRDLTPEERRTKMEAQRDEFTNWLTSQGLSEEKLSELGVFPMMKVFKGAGMKAGGMHERVFEFSN